MFSKSVINNARVMPPFWFNSFELVYSGNPLPDALNSGAQNIIRPDSRENTMSRVRQMSNFRRALRHFTIISNASALHVERAVEPPLNLMQFISLEGRCSSTEAVVLTGSMGGARWSI
jgi:hypothetical protein